jgi:c-di-GMP-binding flagellar brake protein YcgR
MYFKKNGLLLQNLVINLSLGGSYSALIQVENWTDKAPLICVGDKVTDIELIFRVKHFEQRVSIRKAIVVRCEEDNVSGCYACALNFIDLDKAEEKALTELVYVIQREYLKKRPLSI